MADLYDGDWIDEVGTRDGWPEETMEKNRQTTDAQREGFRKAVAAGVRLAFGTDSGVYPHGLNARQLALPGPVRDDAGGGDPLGDRRSRRSSWAGRIASGG